MAIISLVNKLGGRGEGDQNNSAVFNSNAAEFYSWMKASVSSARGEEKDEEEVAEDEENEEEERQEEEEEGIERGG